MRLLTTPTLVLALVLAACSGGAPASSAASDAATPAAAPSSPSPAPEPDLEVEATDEGEDSDAVAFVEGLGDDLVVQTTPISGGGDRPMLTWEDFDGAADYVVAVHDADDQPYWAWTTSDTEVRIGLTERPDAAPGPRVAEGTTWVVIARDVDGVAIASSPRRLLAP